MKERWKPVIGYEGRYEVSTFGNVRSLLTNKVLSPKISRYRSVILCNGKGTKNKMFNIGGLVLAAFRCPRPASMEVDHRNRNKLDDRLANLRWLTRSKNALNSDRCFNNSSGGTPNVVWHKQSQRWRGYHTVDGIQICVGNFTSIIAAKTAITKFKRLINEQNP